MLILFDFFWAGNVFVKSFNVNGNGSSLGCNCRHFSWKKYIQSLWLENIPASLTSTVYRLYSKTLATLFLVWVKIMDGKITENLGCISLLRNVKICLSFFLFIFKFYIKNSMSLFLTIFEYFFTNQISIKAKNFNTFYFIFD